MVQISKKDKEKVHVIYSGKTDAAELALPALAVTAKLKQKTKLTDIPFAVTDAGLLAEPGCNAWDYGSDINNGLFSENVMRRLVKKYRSGGNCLKTKN